MTRLFDPLDLRSVRFRNRVFVTPMCQYSSPDGQPHDWHLVHYGTRAVGGAGLVLVEATAVCPEGRISPDDLGLWSDEQVAPWQRITAFIKAQGAVPGIQIAHAGRKASTEVPWRGGRPLSEGGRGWRPVGPSPEAFAPGHLEPRELSVDEIAATVMRFGEAARRARRAGFEVVEIHMAHGYLVHQFLSPLVNRRGDAYGGPLGNRLRLALEVAAVVRKAWPADFPVFARLSCTDWVDGGWDIAQSLELAGGLREAGVDLIDCSSGGAVASAKIPLAPGYQVPFAEEIRRKAGIPTAAVGLITEPAQAEAIVAGGKADAVLLGRQLLREPYWPLRAAHELQEDHEWPVQYERGRWASAPVAIAGGGPWFPADGDARRRR